MAPPYDTGGPSSINTDGKSFFDLLPRELRDRIYEYTFDHDIRDEHYRYRFRAPQPLLRLVSRQFMHEYDEQTPHNTTLSVTACTNQFERTQFDPLVEIPPLAARCTVADVTLYIGETDGFATDLRDEQYYVRGSLFSQFSNIDRFIDGLTHLKDIRIQLGLNFAQSFDAIYELMEARLDSFRRSYKERSQECSYLPNVNYELHHLQLSYPDLPSCLTSNIPSSEIIERPAILAAFSFSYGQAKKKVIHDNEIKRRMHVEATVLADWEAQHGCTLSQSAKKAAGIVDDNLDREGSESP